jgi:PKD repeat protein
MNNAGRWLALGVAGALGGPLLWSPGLQEARGAVYDYTVPFVFTSVGDAGGLMALRGLDPQGLLQVTNIASAPSQDETSAEGVAAWSGDTVVYYYTYDALRGAWMGGNANVSVAPQDLLTAGGLVAWSSGSTVYYRVYDRLRGVWQGSSANLGAPSRLLVDSGVVAWVSPSGVYFRVYDILTGNWVSGNGPGPTSDLINRDGVVAWSTFGTQATAYYYVYDPTRGGWRNGSQLGATFDLRCSNGVVAWSVNPLVHVRVYDPAVGLWKGNTLNVGYTSELAILGATVSGNAANGPFVQGYRPATGMWGAHSAEPLAVFALSSTSGNAPFQVAFVDMSIGGASWSWDFGDGLGQSTRRSPLYRYTTFGRFTAALNVSGSVASRVILTDTIRPVGTNYINGGAALTTNTLVTLTLLATDNSGVVSDMRVSNEGTNWTAWEAYATNRTWTLTAGNGEKRVQAQFRDATGNTSLVATASIRLDTTAPPVVMLINTNVSENGGFVNVAVVLDHPYSQPVHIRYATADGSATAGSDYTPTNGLLTFPVGITNLSFVLRILQDTAVELNETFTVNFSDATNALAGPAGVVTILDDELPTVAFAATNFNVSEGSGAASISVQLNHATGKSVFVHYTSLTNGTATPGIDFTPVSGVVMIAPGQTLGSFSVPLTGDSQDELSETVNLLIDGVTNAVAGVPPQAVLTIVDDDNPVLNFGRIVYEAWESESIVEVSVVLSKPVGQDVRLNYVVAGGTATAGTDYVAISGPLQIFAGETNAVLLVTLLNDGTPEADETVHVRLTGASGATLGPRSEADVLVLDDDGPPRLLGGGIDETGRYHATLRGPLGQAFRVEYTDDLQVWELLGRYTNTAGFFDFTDPQPVNGNALRVYRSVAP